MFDSGNVPSPRKGGPKEARLKRKNVDGIIPVTETRTFDLRISNLPKTVEVEELKSLFSVFGEIISASVPKNLDSRLPKGFGFVKFGYEDEALAAIEALHEYDYDGRKLKVEFAVQNSFFSQATGYITNETLEAVANETEEFDPSMPSNHYDVKYRNRVIDVTNLITVKVDNIGPKTKPEEIREFYSQFGEIATCHRPMNLQTKKYHNFAFVKYVRAADAKLAIEETHLKWIFGCELVVTAVKQVSLYSQDESTEYLDKKKKPGRHD